MRIKLFFLAFGTPIVFGLIIFFAIGNYLILNMIIGISILLSWIIQVFVIDRKYLQSIFITNGKIRVEYLTSFLKFRVVFINIEDLSSIEFTKANSLIGYPAALNIKEKDGWQEFQLINKKLKKTILNEFAAANISLPKAGLR
jgi:hypothetical protein